MAWSGNVAQLIFFVFCYTNKIFALRFFCSNLKILCFFHYFYLQPSLFLVTLFLFIFCYLNYFDILLLPFSFQFVSQIFFAPHFFVFHIFLLLVNFCQCHLCIVFFFSLSLSFCEMLQIFLTFAFRICFAGHVLLTFISEVNVHEKRWLWKNQLIFNIFLQIPHFHEIWRL